MRTLTLPVKREYFEQIKDGSKTEEYRLANAYWWNRLADKSPDGTPGDFKHFDRITITLGYPPKIDTSRRLEFPWLGYEIKTITHPHFGPDPVRVFAIKLKGGTP